MAKAVGLSHLAIHILQFEKTMKLYQDILGLELMDAVVFHGGGCDEMLSLRLAVGEYQIQLALTAPQNWHQVAEIGNTNHNHFTLKVDDIVTIVERLIAEGYVMEHDNYKEIPYNFFTGPNGEIIGLVQE